MNRLIRDMAYLILGFLLAALMSQAAVIHTTEGQIFGVGVDSPAVFGPADADHQVIAGTWPNGTVKIVPGGGVSSRAPGRGFVMSERRAIGYDGYFYFNWKDTNNWYRIFWDNTGAGAYTVKWEKNVAGTTTTVSTGTAVTGAGTYDTFKIVISFASPTTTVSVYKRVDTGGTGSITTLISAATDTAGDTWVGQLRLQETNASAAIKYYVLQQGDTYRLSGLPGNREAMICDQADVYIGKVTSASDTITYGSSVVQPFQARIKIKTDTDADDCTTGTIHEVFTTHSLLGGSAHIYRAEALILGPAYGPARYQTSDFNVPAWAAFNAAGSMKVGKKLSSDSWPGTPCTGTESCTSEVTLTATASGLGVYRAYAVLTGLAVSSGYDARVYYCASPGSCAVQTDTLSITTPPAPGTDGTLRIIYTTCHSSERRPFVLWSTMAALNPHRTILRGDVYYEGHSTTDSGGNGAPDYEPIARTRAEKEIKMLDVVRDPNFTAYRRSHSVEMLYDDHDAGCNDEVPAAATCNSPGGAAASSLFTNAMLVWDDYVGDGSAAASLNPPALRSGERYYSSKEYNVQIVSPDEITHRGRHSLADLRWYGEAIGAELLTNSGFESCTTEDATPTNWTVDSAPNTGCTTTTPDAGTWAAYADNAILSQGVAVTSGTTYRLQVRIRGTTADGAASVTSGTADTGTTYCTSGLGIPSGYETVVCAFTASSTGTVYVNLRGYGGANTLFDAVSFATLTSSLQGVSGTATDGGSTIDCAACDFVTQNVAADDRAYFGSATAGRWYRVTARNSATQIAVSPNVVCTPNCTAQNLDVVTTIKSMLGAQQFVDFSQEIKGTTADVVFQSFGKALYYTGNADAWGTSGCQAVDQTNCQGRASYGYSYELLDYRTLACNNGATNNDVWMTGDSHQNFLVDHTDIASCSQREMQVGGIGFPSYHAVQRINYGNGLNNHLMRMIASGRSFGLATINTTPGTPTVRLQLYGENGDVLIDSDADPVGWFNASGSVLQYSNSRRIVQHSSGRCVVLIYNGTYQELRMSDPTCRFDVDAEIKSVNATTPLDWENGSGAIAINGDTIYSCFIEGNTDGPDQRVRARTATVNDGASTIAWNADAATILNQGVGYKMSRTTLVRGSDGFLYCAVAGFNEANSNRFTLTLRSATADAITGTWTSFVHDDGETTVKSPTLISTGNGKILFLERFEAAPITLLSNEWTGSAWECAKNALVTVSATIVNANFAGDTPGAGDEAGGALVTYLPDTTTAAMTVKRFTSNASCDASEWGSAITLPNVEPAYAPSVAFFGNKYLVVGHNNFGTLMAWRSGSSTPSAASDFSAVNLSASVHVRYGRMTALSNPPTTDLILITEAGTELSGALTDGFQMRVSRQPFLAGGLRQMNHFQFQEEFDRWLDSLKLLVR